MSEANLFGKESLLAIASELSQNSKTLAPQEIDNIAQQAKLQFIELCAVSLLTRKKLRSDTEYSALARQIPDDACKSALAGAFWLMSVYENLISFRMQFKEAQWSIESAKASRRKRGQYFTPENLTKIATQTALQKLLDVKFGGSQDLQAIDITSLKIVDPAMGAGAFLVCALEFFVTQNKNLSVVNIAANCLFGVDLDPLAADVTYIVLQAFCGLTLGLYALPAIPNLKSRLKVGNSLVGYWIYDDNQKHQNYQKELETFEKHRFDWQLEFSDVFAKGGFDAVLSNPPWETLKPNAREFFSDHNPEYQAIGIVENEIEQGHLLEKSSALTNRWSSEREFFDGFSRYLSASSLRATEIKTKCGINLPFKAQGGSDLNLYKMFVELAYCLLAKNGCMSLIVPSGIYTDHGTMALRELFLDEADVFEVTSYLNRDQTFSIHPSFNFCILSVCNKKGDGDIKVSFGNQNASSATKKSLQTFIYPVKDLHVFSPLWRGLLEVNCAKDLQILRKIYSQSQPLFEVAVTDGIKIKFKREWDLTNDSGSFVSRVVALQSGFVCDQFGNLLKGKWRPKEDDQLPLGGLIFSRDTNQLIRTDEIEDILLPLYEGRMLGQFDCRQKVHISGNGRKAIWKANTDESMLIQSQYFLPLDVAHRRSDLHSIKLGYQAVGSSTNVRTMIAAALSGIPCGNSVPVLALGRSVHHNLALLACLNSFVFDFVLRSKMTGNNINFYLLQECPLPDIAHLAADLDLLSVVACLSFNHERFAREWLQILDLGHMNNNKFESFSALNRLTLRAALDVLVAEAYGLDLEELEWILRDSDGGEMGESTLLKGFWRVDKTLAPAERHTTLTLNFFRRLQDVGRAEFIQWLLSTNAAPSATFEVACGLSKFAQQKIAAKNLDDIYAKESPLSRPLPQTGR